MDARRNSTSSTSSSLSGLDIQIGVPIALPPGAARDLPLESPDWSAWDGGKVGGAPIWLRRDSLPPPAAFTCAHCGAPLLFLCQLYCPLDEEEVGHGGAFHRMLYVFACRGEACVNTAGVGGGAGPAVLVVRQQCGHGELGPSGSPVHTAPGLPPGPGVCAVCGLPAKDCCGKCHSVNYCGVAHQKFHWKNGHKAACGVEPAPAHDDPAAVWALGAAAAHAGVLLAESEIVVEDEPSSAARATALRDSLPEGARATLDGASGADAPPAAEGGSAEDTDLNLVDVSTRSLAALTGATAGLGLDFYADAFQQRVLVERSQVLRYCRWPSVQDKAPFVRGAAGAGAQGAAPLSPTDAEEDEKEEDAAPTHAGLCGAPLWVGAKGQPYGADGTPLAWTCRNCGGRAEFEFQVTPQMLAVAGADPPTFGTLAVYTCVTSCPGACNVEGVWVQPEEA